MFLKDFNCKLALTSLRMYLSSLEYKWLVHRRHSINVCGMNNNHSKKGYLTDHVSQGFHSLIYIMGTPISVLHRKVTKIKRENPQSTLCLAQCKCKCSINVNVTCMLSHVRLSVSPGTAAHQAPLSTGFSKQEYWSGFSFPSLGDPPNPRNQIHVSCISCIGRWIPYQCITWEAPSSWYCYL